MPLRISLALATVLLGCSAESSSDAGSDAPVVPDAGGDGGCTGRVTATFGPAGGTLTHCDGAILEIPPGALMAPTEIYVEPLEEAPSIEAPYVLAGPAFTFGPASTTFGEPARVVLPHEGGERMEMAALVEGEWQRLEVCDSDASTVSQSFSGLGTFVATHDPTVYPPGPSGVGEGSISFVLGAVGGGAGAGDSMSIEYAIDEDVGPGESLAIVWRRSDAEGLEQVELKVGIDGTTVEPVQLAYANTFTSEIWDSLPLLHPGDLTVAITERDGATLTGTIEATLHRGEETRSFSATFTITSGEWRYPPERVCGTIEG